jgi:hypothetical protein
MSQSDSHMDIISPRSMCSWNQLLLACQCHGSSYMQQMLSRRLKCCLQNETPKNNTTPNAISTSRSPAESPARLRV